MKLLIVSHTEHYSMADGTLVGWGPTITEINHLAEHFEEIIHLAFQYEEQAPPSALAYTQPNIRFVPLPIQGGKSFFSKLSLLNALPQTISLVRKYLKEVDVFQFRAPTGMGVYLIPYFALFVKKKGWFKYAGNWNQKSPPLGYRLQRWLLKKQRRTVTINGQWPDQPQHCLTFENPCLTHKEREEGIQFIEKRNYQKPFEFLFVGRLEDEKGVQRILDAFEDGALNTFYSSIHFVGDGPKRRDYEHQAHVKGIKAHFHGFLSRKEVFQLYKSCDFLLLPSTASEGFPKVIAEAMNFGCLPVVSTVSSIGQYVTSQNGYLINPATSDTLNAVVRVLAGTSSSDLLVKANNAYEVAHRFTFELYSQRILSEICLVEGKEGMDIQ